MPEIQCSLGRGAWLGAFGGMARAPDHDDAGARLVRRSRSVGRARRLDPAAAALV